MADKTPKDTDSPFACDMAHEFNTASRKHLTPVNPGGEQTLVSKGKTIGELEEDVTATTSRFASPPVTKKQGEPYEGGYIPPSGSRGGGGHGGRKSTWDERDFGPPKWRKASTTNPRTGRHDPFTDPFFDPHGTRARMNRSSNLRSRSFNDKLNKRGRW